MKIENYRLEVKEGPIESYSYRTEVRIMRDIQ